MRSPSGNCLEGDGMDVEETRSKINAKLLWTIFLILLVAIPVILLSLKEKDSTLLPSRMLRTGRPAPDFAFPDLNGKRVSLSDQRGKVVLVNIWATWCPPCVDEMPSMQKLYGKFKHESFEILAVSIDADGRKAVAPFMEKYKLTFPALLDQRQKIRDLYGTTGVPESYVVDKRGILVKKVIGPLDWSTREVFLFFHDLIQRPAPQ
jgi:peroxiredoxin